jgi:hypothetical protein
VLRIAFKNPIDKIRIHSYLKNAMNESKKVMEDIRKMMK